MRGELSTSPTERPPLIFLIEDTWWRTDPTVTICHGNISLRLPYHIAAAHMLSMATALQSGPGAAAMRSEALQQAAGCSGQHGFRHFSFRSHPVSEPHQAVGDDGDALAAEHRARRGLLPRWAGLQDVGTPRHQLDPPTPCMT